MEFSYEELLRFGTAMSIYALITFPIYIMYIIKTFVELIHEIKKFRILKNENRQKNNNN